MASAATAQRPPTPAAFWPDYIRFISTPEVLYFAEFVEVFMGGVASVDQESASLMAKGLGPLAADILERLGPDGRNACEHLAAAGCERQVLGAVIGPSIAFWDEKVKPSAYEAWRNIIGMASLWAALKARRTGPVRAEVDRMRAVFAAPTAMAMQAGVLAEERLGWARTKLRGIKGDAPARGLLTAYVLAATGKPWDRPVALIVGDVAPKRQAPVTAANQRLWRNRHRLFTAAFVKPLAEWLARPLEP